MATLEPGYAYCRTKSARYDLVCGEGRLEAFQMLGQTEIPAVVIEASESECPVMSLVENIARRTPRPIDLMREIGALRSRGYSDAAIAEKIGVGASWVNMITSLLDRGEERLVAAVETGLIPITRAMEISKAETEEAQNLLLDAYETGKLRGKKLAAVRRMLEMRMQSQRKGALPTGRLDYIEAAPAILRCSSTLYSGTGHSESIATLP